MVADQTAAGLSTDCPHCGGSITVPVAGNDHGELEIDHSLSFESENAQLRQELESTLAECERLAAAATHAQAEIKSFHAERHLLKSELASSRQRLAAAEIQITEQTELLAQAEAQSEHVLAECEALRVGLEIAQQRAAATDTQLSVKENELSALHVRILNLHASDARAQCEIRALQEESDLLRAALDRANDEVHRARKSEARLDQTEMELLKTMEQLQTSEQLCGSLRSAHDELQREVAILRRDLDHTETGRALVELRARVELIENERHRLEVENAQLADDLHKAERQRESLRDVLKATCQRLEDAERRAEASSDERLKQDNMALRGIIARQNKELDQRHVELHRLRRARLFMRLIYGLVVLAFLILAIVTVNLLPTIDW